MKRIIKILISQFLIIGFLITILNSCDKESNNNNNLTLPVITTSVIIETSQSTATCGGNITSDGGTTITARGVCWSTSSNPTTSNEKTIDGTGIGSFTSILTGLIPYSIYYVRAYATNNAGTSYGNEVSITIPSGSISIGQSYGGGIIFFIDSTGLHGLIAAAHDQSSVAEWGCWGIGIGGTSTAIGTGQANTTAIVNGCNVDGNAAIICNDLVLNGYDDWYLPSKWELNEMFLKIMVTGGFAYADYWSSSEMTIYSAYLINFGVNGYQHGYVKHGKFHVRAIRAF